MTRAVADVRAAMQRMLEIIDLPARAVETVVDGRPLHHLEWGSGRPLVLLHGGSGGGANWFRIVPLLADRFRILAPDLPGFGLSAPVDLDGPLGVQAGRVLGRWAEHHGVRNALVAGTSFGGLAAMRLAQASPASCAGLLLLSSAGLGTGVHPVVRLAAMPLLAPAVLAPTRRGTRLLLDRLFTAGTAALPPAHVDALTDYLYCSARAAGTRYAVRTLRAFASASGQREVLTTAELAALTLPVSVVTGARDRLLPPRDAIDAARHFPHAVSITIPGAGHSPNWETPEPVAAAIISLAGRALAPIPPDGHVSAGLFTGYSP